MYDVIVIGAGAMGSATAYHLARDGRRVLLLEQFEVGHTRGSSHGGSRIIRYAHESIDNTRIMPATFDLWRQLENESGEPLLTMTGGLYVAPPDDSFIQGAQTALGTLHHSYCLLTAAETAQDFPQFRLPTGWVALYQEHSGILAASLCVKTMVSQAVRHGANLREQTRVESIEPSGDDVSIRISGAAGAETIVAHQAIITAGPWAKRLLTPLLPAPLPLQVTHQQVAYFPVTNPDLYAIDRCPLYLFTADPHFYGFPIFEMPGHVKIALELLNTPVDPDQERIPAPQAIADLCDIVAHRMVGVTPEPVKVELCLYTETPNRDFIIDRHPAHPQILMGVGFSGRGFKFAIGVGRLLADLAWQEPGSYDSEFWLDRYGLQRFALPPAAQQH